MHAFFIAGTDTGVGKTWTSCRVLEAASSAGMSALGLKPVAAGAETKFDGRMENEDAVALLKAVGEKRSLSIRDVNPICLPSPLSPHIAAERNNQLINVEKIMAAMMPLDTLKADLCLVEGAGGWRVPISEDETMADLARALNLPVILVVGLRLGCINHSLLTAEAIRCDGMQLCGWIANEIDPDMAALEENIATINRHIGAPMLARFSFCQKNASSVHSNLLNISKFLEKTKS